MTTHTQYASAAARRILSTQVARVKSGLGPGAPDAQHLLDAFAEVAEASGLAITKQPGRLTVELPPDGMRNAVGVALAEANGFVCHRGGDARVPGIEWDFAEARFVGTELDDDVAPDPGKRLPRKDALTVLAQFVMQKLQPAIDKIAKVRADDDDD